MARIARDIGPNCEVPAISAGGAVELPLPSTWILTFGYILRNASAHSVIMLFIVSEPTLLMLPETPEVFWYAAMPGSTWTCWASAGAARARSAATVAKRFMRLPLIDSAVRLATPGNGGLHAC